MAKIRMLCMRFSILLIIIALTPLLAAPSAVHALNCQIVQFNVDSPGSASPGQTIQVNTTINIACTQSEGGTYYTGRVDLVDEVSTSVLSKGTFTIGANPNATATVPNSATVPQTSGAWKLDVILYIFESGGMIAVTSHSLEVQVSSLPFPVSGGPNYLAVGAVIAVVVVVGLALMIRKRKRNA